MYLSCSTNKKKVIIKHNINKTKMRIRQNLVHGYLHDVRDRVMLRHEPLRPRFFKLRLVHLHPSALDRVRPC